MSKFKIFIMLTLVFFWVFVVFFSYHSILEAYGSGSPYYSRTTNMDKWEDPIPVIFLLTIFLILITAFFVQLFKKNN